MSYSTEFLTALTDSIKVYAESGSNSNQKLKSLHGKIKEYISEAAVIHNFNLNIVGLDRSNGKELNIPGKYFNKNVDIGILDDSRCESVVEIKYAMQNYSQNANNYFEGMLGQTSNMQAAQILCHQVVILFDKYPYFTDDGILKSFQTVNVDSLTKYESLSFDHGAHVPATILLIVLRNPYLEDIAIGDSRSKYVEIIKSGTKSLAYSDICIKSNRILSVNDVDK